MHSVHLNTLPQACAEVAEALERCRELSFYHRYLGGCNEAKQKLIMCLRKEVQCPSDLCTLVLSDLFTETR
jgi:hypothetical protein